MKPVAVMVLLAVVLVEAASACAWQPSVPPITPPSRSAFTQDQITRGAELAAIGDCMVCHTAQGGQPYAGGRGVPTPFGLVYATNITPDAETGIGRWSEVAFRRAMREGIGRGGEHLYPVLPYPHFTRATGADISAMYAFLMTRTPVHATTPPSRLPFPLNQRVLLAGWNLLFLRPGPWHPDPTHDAVWNRGQYLVEAVGHCGGCHSPRNVFGAEDSKDRLSGGQAENWYAPPLQGNSPARLPWTQAEMETYLRTGFQAQHGAAAGPMAAVTAELGQVSAPDIAAIATYVAAAMPKAAAVPVASRPAPDDAAAAMFRGACGGCHGADAPMTRNGTPSLALSTSVNAPTPQGLIQVILIGLPWRGQATAQPYMPGFAAALTDDQVAAIAAYVRTVYSDKPAWTDLPAQVAKLRQAGGA